MFLSLVVARCREGCVVSEERSGQGLHWHPHGRSPSSLPMEFCACSRGMAPPAAFLASGPPIPGICWHFGLDFLCCPCTSHSCGAASPSWSKGELIGLCFRVFRSALSMYLADKRPFSPASLYACVAFSCVVGYLCLACSVSPFLYFPLSKSLNLQVYFGSLVATDTYVTSFVNKVIFLSCVL